MEGRIAFTKKEQDKLFKKIYPQEEKAALSQIKEHEKRKEREEEIKKKAVKLNRLQFKSIIKNNERATIKFEKPNFLRRVEF